MSYLLLCLVLAQTPPQTPATEGTALITGRVVDGMTKSPVSAAIVSIGAPGFTRRTSIDSVITDGDGRNFFDRITAGTYNMTVTKPGWLDGAVGRRRPEGEATPFTIKSDDRRSDVELQMWKRSLMSGTVLDEAGEPVVDVLVWAVRRKIFAGRPQMELTTAVRTDDRGAFRLSGLVPGNYSVLLPTMISSGPITFAAGSAPMEWLQTMTGLGGAPLSVDRQSGIAAGDGRNVVTGMTELASGPADSAPWMTLPPTFFGGSSTTPTFVSLEPGQERQGMTIAARRVPTQSISGVLVVPGASAASYALHLLPASMADFPLFDVATAVADASGAFTFYGIPSGNYVIRVVRVPAPKGPNARATTAYVDVNRKFVSISAGFVRGAPPPPVDTEPLLFANEPVTVGDTAVRGLTITLRQGVRLSGRADFVGTAPPPLPDSLPTVPVAAGAANGFVPYMASQYSVGHLSTDGTFTTPSLVPGQYVLAPGATSPWTVKSVTAGGVDVTDLPIDVTSDVGDIVITYTDRVDSIRGTVTAQGAEDPHASVLMFSTRAEHWVDYGHASGRMKRARTSTTGTFSLTARPGDYFVIAFPDDEIADWRDPAFLAKLAPRAQRVSVRAGESPTLSLSTVSIK
jgi:hypothetical protein